MNTASYALAQQYISAVRKSKSFPLDDGPLGDDQREDLLLALPAWVASRKGWLYLAINQDVPGQCKIGCTRKGISSRMASLSVNWPSPWEPLVYWAVYDAYGIEALVHKACANYRATQEFFRCNAPELVAQIRAVIDEDQASFKKDWKRISPHDVSIWDTQLYFGP